MKICVKTITWRIIGTGTTMMITWIITHNIQSGLTIGLIDMGVSSVLFYIHEHIWSCCLNKNEDKNTYDILNQ